MIKPEEKPEILSPAGDTESLKAALMYGADAVYLGKKSFGMRAAPENFSQDELVNACALAHLSKRKVYLVCNTLPHSREIPHLKAFAEEAVQAGVDAFIVSDIGVMAALREYAPDIAIHISTQAGVVNYMTACELYKMGAERVILARELRIDEIREIRDKTPPELEIEVFVHGAMCVSFSGRCLLSQYLTSRDANLGHCAQPCRWSYALMEKSRQGEYYPIYEDDGGTYILNARDLNLIEHLDKLADAGVSSFKIEGRAKSAYYTAVITNAYRAAVDFMADNPGKHLPHWITDETEKVSHREYSTGFVFNDAPPTQNYRDGGYIRRYDFAAVVIKSEGGWITVKQRSRFFCGDTLDVLLPAREPMRITADEITDADGNPVEAANKAAEIYKIRADLALPEGTMLRIKRTEEEN